MKTTHSLDREQASEGFSLIELLVVIAIIGVLASMTIAAFSNATQDSREVVVLQQQAVLQGALNNWISQESSAVGSGSLALARVDYAAASTGVQKLALVSNYLDDSTAAQFTAHGSVANALVSPAMTRVNKYITFSAWADGDYPKVEIGP